MGVLLGIVIVVLIGACGYLTHKNFKQKANKRMISGIVAIGALLLSLIFVPFGFVQVETGEIAVVKVWGNAKDVKTEGLHFRNIISTSYTIYDLKTQDIRTSFESYTKDGQAVSVQLTTQFRIQSDKVLQINKQFGSLNVLKQRVDALSIVGTKEILSTYEAMVLIQQRGTISSEVLSKIGTSFNEYYIDITQILVTDIAFTETFENMIEEKKLAEQQLEKAKIELERQLAEAENKVKIAEAEAREKLAQAQGEADAITALATAEAEKIELLALAEAEALRIKSIELAKSIGINIIVDAEGNETIDNTDPQIDLLRPYLEYIAYLESWDGKLPEILMGDNVDVILPLP